MVVPSVLGPEPIPLGLGVYTIRESWVKATISRECFLDAMVLIAPATLQTLVTTIGMQLAKSAEESGSLAQYRALPGLHGDHMFIFPARGVLDGYLQAWKRQWRLPDPWVDVLACETLVIAGRLHQKNQGPLKRFVTFSISANKALFRRKSNRSSSKTRAIPTTLDLPEIDCTYPDGSPAPVWDPFHESRAAAKQQLMKLLEVALDQFLDGIEKPWKSTCYIPTPVKRHPEHFDWVVHYQVLGRSYGTIQKTLAPGVSRQAIAKAVKETAELIGLTLRGPNRPGAPRRKRHRTVKVSTHYSQKVC